MPNAIPPPPLTSATPLAPIAHAKTPGVGFLAVVERLDTLQCRARRPGWNPGVYIRAWLGEVDTFLGTTAPEWNGQLSLSVEDCLATDGIVESLPVGV